MTEFFKKNRGRARSLDTVGKAQSPLIDLFIGVVLSPRPHRYHRLIRCQ